MANRVPTGMMRAARYVAVLLLCVAGTTTAQDAAQESEADTIARCLRDLQSDSVDIRQRATLVLGKYTHPHAREGLMAALRDPEALIRRSAVVGLTAGGRIDTPTAAAILRMIGDPDIQVRRLASFHIQMCYLMGRGQVGGETRRAIVEAFTDDDATVRKNMIAAHAVLGALLPDAVIAQLLQDPEREVRILALDAAMNSMRGDQLLEVVEPILRDPDATMRQRLAQHLGQAHMEGAERLLEKLQQDEDPGVARTARLGMYIGKPTREHFQALMPDIDAANFDGDTIREIVRMMPLIGANGIAMIRDLTEHPRAVVREAALNTYARYYPDDGDLPLVLRMLRDDSPAIRKIALALLVHEHPKLPQKTVMTLVANPHPDIRLAALEISRQLAREEAEEVIMELILDDDTEVRGRAIQDVGVRHVDGWQDILRATLDDPDEAIVVAAVDALFRAGTDDAVKILKGFTRTTKNEALRRAIENELQRMQPATRRETL